MIICFSILVATTLPIHGAKLGLASAWLFEEAGGKVVKDMVGNHKGDSYAHHDVFNADPYTFTAWTKLKPTTWQYICAEKWRCLA